MKNTRLPCNHDWSDVNFIHFNWNSNQNNYTIIRTGLISLVTHSKSVEVIDTNIKYAKLKLAWMTAKIPLEPHYNTDFGVYTIWIHAINDCVIMRLQCTYNTQNREEKMIVPAKFFFFYFGVEIFIFIFLFISRSFSLLWKSSTSSSRQFSFWKR